MNEKNKEIFKKQAGEYAEASYWRFDEEILVEKFFTKRPSSLLVLGCGGGRTLQPLAAKGFSVTAIDIVPEMVTQAKEKVKDLSLEVFCMDAAHLSFKDNSFDYVFFPFHGIDYVTPTIFEAVKEAARVLRPDGVFIFNSHNRFSLTELKHIFKGSYTVYKGILTYRTTPFDWILLKRYFKNVRLIQRITLQPWKQSNWKDICYKLFPFLNKSTYYVCSFPKKST